MLIASILRAPGSLLVAFPAPIDDGDAAARPTDRATRTGIQVIFACHDPDALTSFWAAALGSEKQWSWDEGTVREMRAQGVREDQVNQRCAAVDPAGARPRVFFRILRQLTERCAAGT